jgi:hypothetical protein
MVAKAGVLGLVLLLAACGIGNSRSYELTVLRSEIKASIEPPPTGAKLSALQRELGAMCKAGDAHMCAFLGDTWSGGPRQDQSIWPVDPVPAFEAFTQACALSFTAKYQDRPRPSFACMDAAGTWLMHPAAISAELAAPLKAVLQAECAKRINDLLGPYECVTFVAALEGARGPDGPTQEIDSLLPTVCAIGSCEAFAKGVASERYGRSAVYTDVRAGEIAAPNNPTRAAQIAEIACAADLPPEQRDPTSCLLRYEWFKSGAVGNVDLARAAEFKTAGCAIGAEPDLRCEF